MCDCFQLQQVVINTHHLPVKPGSEKNATVTVSHLAGHHSKVHQS